MTGTKTDKPLRCDRCGRKDHGRFAPRTQIIGYVRAAEGMPAWMCRDCLEGVTPPETVCAHLGHAGLVEGRCTRCGVYDTED